MASRSEYETALANGEAAVAMARRVSPPEIVATALTAQNNCLLSLWQPQRALELIREVEAAQSPFTSASRTVARVWVSFRALVSLLQLGERDEIDRIVMLLHGDQGATALGFQRAFLEQHAAALALAEGRLDDAEARVARALEWAPDHPNIVRSASAQRWAIRLEQDGIDPHRLDVMSKSRPTPWLEALAALVHAEHGDVDEAAAALKVFATREDLGIPFNTGQAPTLRALAETAAHVGDAPFARALTPYVAPYTGQLFAAFFGHFCDGAADRALGQLALAQDDPDTAVAHLHAALALEDDFRAPALTARTRYWLALALGARNHAGDDEEAEREAASAARTAGSCGLASIQHLVERLEHSGRALGVVQRDAD
jgi:tetratricopeptide (TPR) repeat protein